MARALHILAGLLLANAVFPQDGGTCVAVPESEMAKKLELVRKGKKIVQVRWRERTIPLPGPVENCACGLSPGGDILVVLAGGVRGSLDILIARGREDLYRFGTDGGRRLPEPNKESRGSWPWLEGEHLILFAFEKDRKLEFRAVSLAGSTHASRSLDVKNDAWTVDSRPDAGSVEVRFPQLTKPLVFSHPLAPRLELKAGTLDFGEVEVQQTKRHLLTLKNTGRRQLRASFSCDGKEVRVQGDQSIKIDPGQSRVVVVLFRPEREGALQRHVKVLANGRNSNLSVSVCGVGIKKATKVVNKTSPTSQPVRKPTKPAVPPPQPALIKLRLHPLGAGRILIVGRLDKAPRKEHGLWARCGKRLVRLGVDTQGRFSGEIEAKAGWVDFALRSDGGLTSGFVARRVAPAELSVERGEVVVRGLPGQRFLLMLLPKDSDFLLDSWRSKIGPSGEWRLQRRQLPETNGESVLVLARRDGAGQVSSARVVLR